MSNQNLFLLDLLDVKVPIVFTPYTLIGEDSLDNKKHFSNNSNEKRSLYLLHVI